MPGINAAIPNGSVLADRDGTVVAAAGEEHVSRVEHGWRPACCSTWNLSCLVIDAGRVDAVVPLLDVESVACAFDPILLDGVQKPAWHSWVIRMEHGRKAGREWPASTP